MTLLEHVRCNLCGADNGLERYPTTISPGVDGDWRAFRCTHSGYGCHHTIVQCQQCGLVYTDPRPDGHDIIRTLLLPIKLLRIRSIWRSGKDAC